VAFSTTILVRFSDLDPAGIAYYPNLVNFLHVAFEDFFAGFMGRPYPRVFEEGLGFPTVKVEMDYLSPVHYGDHVEVKVVVEHVGKSSVRFRYEGSVLGKAVFLARNTAVVVDMRNFRPIPIPGSLRDRLQQGMEPTTS
jgi:YbgC/YbaW family acyl-CoA thioester hydrolase